MVNIKKVFSHLKEQNKGEIMMKLKAIISSHNGVSNDGQTIYQYDRTLEMFIGYAYDRALLLNDDRSRFSVYSARTNELILVSEFSHGKSEVGVSSQFAENGICAIRSDHQSIKDFYLLIYEALLLIPKREIILQQAKKENGISKR